MNFLIFRLMLLFSMPVFCSCSIKSEKKYVVVDSFQQIVLETDDEDKAFDQAEKMTLLGRVFASKPQYFVIRTDK